MIDKNHIRDQAEQFRNSIGEDNASPIDIFRIARKQENLTLVHYPFSKNISGICIKTENNITIAINSTHTLGRQNFTLAHEFYHAYFDEATNSICTKGINEIKKISENEKSDTEKSADQFASYFLIPPVALQREFEQYQKENKVFDLAGVIALEQFYGVSRSAMLIGLLEKGLIKQSTAESMRADIISSAAKLGYPTDLYRPLPIEKQTMTFGVYIKRANRLFSEDIISSGKYEELLLTAFRSDLVYGCDEDEIND